MDVQLVNGLSDDFFLHAVGELCLVALGRRVVSRGGDIQLSDDSVTEGQGDSDFFLGVRRRNVAAGGRVLAVRELAGAGSRSGGGGA